MRIMKKTNCINKSIFLVLPVIILFFCIPVMADEKANISDDFTDYQDLEDGGADFLINGFIETENFFSLRKEQEPDEIFRKNELRLRLNAKIGTEFIYFKAEPNLYILPSLFSNDISQDYSYSDEYETARNGRLSGESFELAFNQFFFNVDAFTCRFRIGNQVFKWGTADAYNPTSYFNPEDTRELFFRDSDEQVSGIPAVSFTKFLGDFSLEVVFVPVHIAAVSPVQDNFWAYHYSVGPVAIQTESAGALDIEPENFGTGARFSGALQVIDFSVSFYHGPDRDPVLRPVKTIAESESLEVLVRPEYYNVTMYGVDFSSTLGKFVIQGEAVYSHNKTGVIDQPYDDPVGSEMTWPFEVKESGFVSYAGGFNFFHDTFIITTNWMQSRFFNNGYMDALLSDILTVRIEDTFLDEYLKLKCTGAYDVRNHGYFIMPEATVKFLNGISLRVAAAFIKEGESELNVFSLYNQNDILIVRLQYEF